VNNIEGTRQINPVTSEEGGLLFKQRKVTRKWEERLFTKNTGLCKIVK